MEIGDERLFKYRVKGKSIIELLGKVIDVNNTTRDGLKIVEVQFRDKVRKYSLDHLS